MPRSAGGMFELGELARPTLRRRIALRLLVVVLSLGLLVAGWQGWRLVSATALDPTCTATYGGERVVLSPEQSANASVIAAVALRRGLPTRVVTIALATAWQESKLRNLRYGDRDSLGLFQQRPSQGWGSADQVLDPVYASNAFYDRLVRVKDYLSRPLTDVAQQVQRSAAPTAYAQHEDEASILAAALTGTEAALTCQLRAPTDGGQPATVVDRLGQHHGLTARLGLTGEVLLEAPTARAWAVAAWAVANAESLQVTRVTVGGRSWARSDGQWATAPPSASSTGESRVTVSISQRAL